MGFDEVIIMFDGDDVGVAAAQAVAETLPVGRAKIASLPAKDANECLVNGQGHEIINAIFQAKDYSQTGLSRLTNTEMSSQLMNKHQPSPILTVCWTAY